MENDSDWLFRSLFCLNCMYSLLLITWNITKTERKYEKVIEMIAEVEKVVPSYPYSFLCIHCQCSAHEKKLFGWKELHIHYYGFQQNIPI